MKSCIPLYDAKNNKMQRKEKRQYAFLMFQTSWTTLWCLWQADMNVTGSLRRACENCSWSCRTAVVYTSLTFFFSCRLETLAWGNCSFQTVSEDGWCPGVWDKKWKLTGLGAVGRCEPGECTSHRNRRSVRKFLSRPTNGGERRKRGKSGQRAALLQWRMDCLLMSAEIPPRWIRWSYKRGSWADIWPQSGTDSPGTSFVTVPLIHLSQSLPSLTPSLTSDLWTLTET